MLSAEVIASTKIAITLCNSSALKRLMLSIPFEDSNRQSRVSYDREHYRNVKMKWDENLESESSLMLEKIGLGNLLREKVVGLVLLIGMRMVTWAKYHECLVGIPRNFSINFLKTSFFTTRGIIDGKKAAEELMKCRRLNPEQRYKLACIYCFMDQIPDLYGQMSLEEKKKFYNEQNAFTLERHSELVTFWTYFVVHKVDKLIASKSIDLLDMAVESACKAAVAFCIERSVNNENKTTFIDLATNILNVAQTGFDFPSRYEHDWMLFIYRSDCRPHSDLWKASDYFIDTLCFIIDKMTESQLIEYLKKDIRGVGYEDAFEAYEYLGVLSLFLFWPYQDYFMKTVNLTWEFLPEWIFADLLVKICDKSDPGKGTLKYGEGKAFNYRKLYQEFWGAAPLRYKRYLFSRIDFISQFIYDFDTRDNRKGCKDILSILLSLKNFTNDDIRIIELIFESATDEEKRNVFLSDKIQRSFIDLINVENWERFDLVAPYFFSSTEVAAELKKEFVFSKRAQAVCINFVKDQKWEAAESFLKWTAFTEEEIIQLKRGMILSDDAEESFSEVVIENASLNVANKFCEWFSSSGGELREFKKSLISSEFGNELCYVLVKRNKLKFCDKLTNWSLSSSEEISRFKENLASKYGGLLCKHFISNSVPELASHPRRIWIDRPVSIFQGGKWKQLDLFLNWCYPSKKEIINFKREKVFDTLGLVNEILSDLIQIGQLKEAERFFLWMNLSFEEINNIKNELLSSFVPEFCKYVTCFGNKFFSWEGDKWENFERFLRWILVDKQSIYDLKQKLNEFRQLNESRNNEFLYRLLSENDNEWKIFYQLIDKLLNSWS